MAYVDAKAKERISMGSNITIFKGRFSGIQGKKL